MIEVKQYGTGFGVTVRKRGSRFNGTFKAFATLAAATTYAEGMARALGVAAR